jgi:hypothetical protein
MAHGHHVLAAHHAEEASKHHVLGLLKPFP